MSMKVGSTSSAKSVGSARKTGGVSSSGATGFSALLGEVEETSAPSVAATANVGGVEALLAAQAVGELVGANIIASPHPTLLEKMGL